MFNDNQMISINCGDGTRYDVLRSHLVGFFIGENDTDQSLHYSHVLGVMTTGDCPNNIFLGSEEACRRVLDSIYRELEFNIVNVGK